MPDDSNTNNIDNDPHNFLLYGITYLLATPSEFSQNIAPKGDDAMKSFLGEAKIPTDGQTACITFANKLMTDEGLKKALQALHAGLQTDFSDTPYAPTPCPNGTDSIAIMKSMAKISNS